MKFNAEASLHLDDRTSKVEIHVSDSASRGKILTLSLTPEQFANLMSNRRISDIEADIDPKVKNVGRQRISTWAVIRVLGGTGFYDKGTIKAYLSSLGAIQGWTLGLYLGAQDSLTTDGKDLLIKVNAFQFLPRGSTSDNSPTIPTKLTTTVRIQDVKSKAAAYKAKGR